jgi:hypothetical protein
MTNVGAPGSVEKRAEEQPKALSTGSAQTAKPKHAENRSGKSG